MWSINSLRNKALAWLIKELDVERKRALYFTKCQLDEGALLLPEAEVNNFSEDPTLIKVGAHSYIRGRLLTYAHGGSIEIGEWCYVGLRSEIWSMKSVIIGDRVLISHHVNIHDGSGHSFNAEERHRHFKQIILKGHTENGLELPGVKCAPVIIEDDVWIGFGVTILHGVRIGKRSVIAAGSLVTKDIPPDSFYRSQITPVIKPLNQMSTRDVQTTI